VVSDPEGLTTLQKVRAPLAARRLLGAALLVLIGQHAALVGDLAVVLARLPLVEERLLIN